MKILKITSLIIVAIIIAFVWYLGDLAADYREGVRLVAVGEYEAACKIFAEHDWYQDSEVLKEYCEVMAKYDAFDYASVFRTYHNLQDIDVDNEALEVNGAAARAEIAALYIHCGC